MNTQNIGDLIKQLAANQEEVYSKICRVVSVNGIEAELAPVDGDANLLGVKLISGDSNTPLLITPVVDSIVIATFLTKDTAFISLYSEIEEIHLRGDQHGGLVKVSELVDKINQLENKFNTLIAKFNTHVHTTLPFVPLPGPPIPTTPTATPETPIAPITLISDIENDLVKHG